MLPAVGFGALKPKCNSTKGNTDDDLAVTDKRPNVLSKQYCITGSQKPTRLNGNSRENCLAIQNDQDEEGFEETKSVGTGISTDQQLGRFYEKDWAGWERGAGWKL